MSEDTDLLLNHRSVNVVTDFLHSNELNNF